MVRTTVKGGLLKTLLAGLALAGCTVEPLPEGESTESVTHAVVVVERSAEADAPEAVKAEAFAGFLSLPRELEPGRVLPIAELALDLPTAGACKKVEPDRRPVSTDELSRAELLDAGEVTLVAGGVVTTLAPRAFPSAADAISGVVYTTRDRAAEPLPAATRYTVATSGSGSLDPISAELPAPAALSGVTLLGNPFGEVGTVPADGEVELRWDAGAAGDVVYVSVETDGGSTLCAFRDDAGRGALPKTALP
ncbi:MAG TPA: hypothetical protein VFV94_16910, partial [Polyangiaceae bacterium]|nr:hypothetical protein [Polyangiaceae bacterium]